MAMVQRILIANRGEIAVRVVRTARALGIETVALYSQADRHALHVTQADTALALPGVTPGESYLNQDAVLDALHRSGADAVHPGYGFLSENAEFAQAVADAGAVFIGPTPQAIRAMGLKDAAKARMDAAGVPVVPGYLGEDQSPAHMAQEAQRIGYPVLIKARAGGGGKGMRKVDTADAFADALESCQREAQAAFGDPTCLIEKWITTPRHIEFQIFGDAHGAVVHLYERDCTLQRRHQKVIEEAPAPGMTDEMREAMGTAAVAAARAVDYRNAGTVEFIVDATDGLRPDRFYFMEMNTRLQVEHPVTEAITGIDLVEWQIQVARGAPLPLRQDQIPLRGWAMEARVYAEDPATGFLPSTGHLRHVRFGAGARVDTGVGAGDEITPYYDPMIAKLIVQGDTRSAALGALSRALDA
ncbi:MAG: biotin carboxylase N-terminal domain-containing protein, partial [Pseudomonadota bacterium]